MPPPRGGEPVPAGETSAANSLEIGMFLRAPLTSDFEAGGVFITGSRRIAPAGRDAISDPLTVGFPRPPNL